MAENITEIQSKTIALIDRLKAITFNAGLGGGGNEYIILTEIFLYKFLNDKFVHEAKKWNKNLVDAENIQEVFDSMTEDEYDDMCDCMDDVVELRKDQLLTYIATQRNEPNFAQVLDDTLENIAKSNQSIFFIQNTDNTSDPILHRLSEYVNGGQKKRDEFCKALIEAITQFSFEDAFSAGYDFFSTIFEYLIKDYNANGGGTYAEYYTPHSVASIMAQLLVDPSEELHSKKCYDPSAGTGTLLIALAHAIGPKNCTAYSQDISDKSSTMLMLNMILNGFAHSLNHVVHGNTLANPFHKADDSSNDLRKFDYIVSNPPFKLDFSDYHAELKNDPYKGRFFAGIPNIPNKDKSSMEIYLCFFQHLLYSLNNEGKAAIVVPTGFITAKSGIALKIRKHLVDNGWLRGVVSMPSNIFANTGTNVSVILIDKTNKEANAVFIDASKLGETVKEGKNQKTKLNPEDVKQIVDSFRERIAIEDFSVIPSFEEIKEKNYSFSAGQYFEVRIEHVHITEEEFNQNMASHKSALLEKFKESKSLEDIIVKHIDCLSL